MSLSSDTTVDIDARATINTLPVLDPDCLGYLGHVECRMLFGRRYVVATARADTPAPVPNDTGPPSTNTYTGTPL